MHTCTRRLSNPAPPPGGGADHNLHFSQSDGPRFAPANTCTAQNGLQDAPNYFIYVHTWRVLRSRQHLRRELHSAHSFAPQGTQLTAETLQNTRVQCSPPELLQKTREPTGNPANMLQKPREPAQGSLRFGNIGNGSHGFYSIYCREVRRAYADAAEILQKTGQSM